jgi:rod shape-determining protein MreC
MLKRPHYMALGFVGLLTLILLNLPHHTANQIKLAIGSFYLPLFGLSKSSQQVMGKTSDAMTPRSQLLLQNEELRRTNAELQVRAMQADALQRENDRLRQLFGWEKQSTWQLRLARVVAHDPANWWHSVTIDVGSRDGMKPFLPVMTPSGLVGRISRVTLTSSEVVLVGSSECKVSALVRETGDNGVITGGASPLDNSLVTLSFLASSANLKPGQKVVTWGEGEVFPKGIVIGQVAEDSRPTDLGYTEARVKLSANFGALEEVWVLMR